MSLRRRIALTAAVAVAVAVVLGSLVAYAVVRDTLRGQIDASLRVPPGGNVSFSGEAAAWCAPGRRRRSRGR